MSRLCSDDPADCFIFKQIEELATLYLCGRNFYCPYHSVYQALQFIATNTSLSICPSVQTFADSLPSCCFDIFVPLVSILGLFVRLSMSEVVVDIQLWLIFFPVCLSVRICLPLLIDSFI